MLASRKIDQRSEEISQLSLEGWPEMFYAENRGKGGIFMKKKVYKQKDKITVVQ